MLVELKVSHFAIIDNIHLQFGPGLNIISGETGAGKSILLKSLGLLMGDKALSESVRTGQDFATIEGAFDLESRPDILERLEQMGIEAPDHQLIVKRIVSSQNKSRIYLNSSLSTLTILRDVVSPLVEVTGQSVPLIEMTGQHDNRNLLSARYHLELLDQYAQNLKLRNDYETLYSHYREILNHIESLKSEERERNQRLDFLIYQRDEIEALELRPGEEVLIENETKKLKYSSRLSDFVQQSEDILFEQESNVLEKIQYLLNKSSEIKKHDPELSLKFECLTQVKEVLQDLAYELSDYKQSLDVDPQRLEELESRLSRLRSLQKKYGASAEEILLALQSIQSEIARIENSEEELSSLQKEIQALNTRLKTLALDLHQKRIAGALKLKKSVESELQDLNMKGVQFEIQIHELTELNATGLSFVEFCTKHTQSDTAKPLAKFASGGELSRILLAIKKVVGHSKFPRTYLFDEVDTGVSGPTAEKVGRKLKSIAHSGQVICVTHLPQVACFADHHFLIQKSQDSQHVQMNAHELKNKERIREIARLVSGESITKTSLAHAEELLKSANL